MRKRESWLREDYRERLFSVIVPTFNRDSTIIETLNSVWNQTYRPIEIVIVDDGSQDNTHEVVETWIQEHPVSEEFDCIYEYQKNAGVCAARNRALRKSEGQYIQFLDSDDTIYSERLSRLFQVFQKTGCDYIETGFEGFLTETGEVVSTHPGHVERNQLQLLLLGQLWPNTLRPAYTRQLIAKTGPWNEDMVTLQDYEYVIRALTQVPLPKCEAIAEVLASARRDSTGRMSDIIFTKQGRSLRIHCERLLCEAVKDNNNIPEEWKSQLASRIYALGFRTNAKGWSDLGKQCGELASSMSARLDAKGRLRRLVWKSGRIGGVLYSHLSRYRRALAV